MLQIHYPAAAYMNHSCLPNIEAKLEGGGLVVRALHAIPAGSEINNIYVPLTVEDSERKAMIQGTWKFTCLCARCMGGESDEVARFDEAFLCVCGGASASPTKEGTLVESEVEGVSELLLCRCNTQNLQTDVLWPGAGAAMEG